MQQINLYQAELKPQTVWFAGIRAVQLTALTVVVLALLSIATWWQLQPVIEREQNLQAKLVQSEARVEQVRADFPPSVVDNKLVVELTARRETLAQTQEIVIKLQTGAYGSVAGLTPYLEGFARQHVEGTWLTGVRVESGGAALALEGKTLRPELVPLYLERLAKEAIFKGKSFSDLQLNTVDDGLNAIEFAVRTPGVVARDDS